MFLKLKMKSQKRVEVFLVVLNAVIFLFIYFYFDTLKDVDDIKKLQINEIFKSLNIFLNDPTHWDIIIGGIFLSVTISLGRYEIVNLKERVTYLFGKYVIKM